MRVVCPSCQSVYEVPQDAFQSGARRLRCARCGHEWSAETADAAIGPAPAPPPAPATAEPPPKLRAVAAPEAGGWPSRPPSVPERHAAAMRSRQDRAETDAVRSLARGGSRRGGILVAAGWVVTLAVFAGVVYAAYIWRADIMTNWPPSERLYAALGLH